MTTFATRKEFDVWARHRLAEMDAGLAAMEAEMAAARESVIAAGSKAMDEARLWRDRFADCMLVASTEQRASYVQEAAADLQEAWFNFETEMENWAVAAEQKNAAFDARAKALLGIWHAAAAGYKAQALAATGGQRPQIEAAIARLERDAAAYSEKFENLKDAGKFSWVAMGEALKESRAAFERASNAAQSALSSSPKH